MLDATEFPTVAGPIKFAKGVNVTTPGMVGQWQKNEFEIVWPKSLATGDRGGAEAGLGVTLRAAARLCSDIVVGGTHHGRHLRPRRARAQSPVRPHAGAERGARRVPDAGRLRHVLAAHRLGRQPAADAAGHGPGGLRRRPRAPPPALRARCSAGEAARERSSRARSCSRSASCSCSRTRRCSSGARTSGATATSRCPLHVAAAPSSPPTGCWRPRSPSPSAWPSTSISATA